MDAHLFGKSTHMISASKIENLSSNVGDVAFFENLALSAYLLLQLIWKQKFTLVDIFFFKFSTNGNFLGKKNHLNLF